METHLRLNHLSSILLDFVELFVSFSGGLPSKNNEEDVLTDLNIKYDFLRNESSGACLDHDATDGATLGFKVNYS